MFALRASNQENRMFENEERKKNHQKSDESSIYGVY